MGENTKIEWADHTFNPWIGCTKVSAGCANCYAERDYDHRFHRAKWGPGQPRVRTSAANWKKPIAWNRQAQEEGRRFRVFCASLADVFDPEVPTTWRTELLQLIDDTPHLDWLLLTKRPELVSKLLGDASHGNVVDFRHMPNVWLGTSVENQAAADARIPALLGIQAKVRFLSMEPLLGPVDFRKVPTFNRTSTNLYGWWVIVGGESGPGARPMHPQWVRALRDQCSAAGVPFLFKQWGEWAPTKSEASRHLPLWKRPETRETDLAGSVFRVRGKDVNWPVLKVGKQAAGRLLDGRTWDGVPTPSVHQ